MKTKTKTLLLNIFFHVVVLGIVVKPLLFPSMPGEHWIALIGMMYIMDPIIAFFYGWDMTLRGTVGADAPKYQRIITLLVGVAVYIFILLMWFGVIGDFPDGNGG
ncbi:hypothetical protein [Mariprofundus ferrooxydans]|uniref:Uncharacterized protein n=1 Tax=Mariprofundus ferrooxydans PV-1 TaxID=314345 RepID=Q0EY04_9PROT|nr:hypothetical protein [Mariprofundus ferrooxydans]EAU54222.1 hypothetical protein SPV1_05657 [Mariprofundus ferrooxydans PV-1]KON47769.1 hypothetical protein AL013_06025 [Mariprofundus ferrooxydans]